MKTLPTLAGIALALLVQPVSAAEPASADTPILWKGVEVVSNDFASIPRIREATPIAPGALLSMSDPKLRIACDAVRGRFPSSRIECTNVVETNAGAPQAWFVVEVDVPERAPLRCLQGARLDPALGALSREWFERVGRSAMAGAGAREHLNDRDYVDYDDAELSVLAARLHGATRGRGVELEAASVSCNSQDRTASFYLMGFSGDAQMFITMAATHINDEVASVADAATRFLTLFAEFVEPRTIPHVASEACKIVLSGDFAGRRRALGLLSELHQRGTLPFGQLASDCQGQIRNIARTTLVLPAKELLSGPPT